MTALNRPPSDITPQAFFESWLPGEYARLMSGLSATPPDLAACIDLSGEGGGAWMLSIRGGSLTVSQGQDTADVLVRQSVEDWRLVTLEADNADIPVGSASIDKLLMHSALGQVLATRGTLRVEIPGFQGRTFAVAVTFQGANEPSATISVDADTVAQIRAGTLPAPQAFFGGKIQISGDVTLAMQIGMAMMAPA